MADATLPYVPSYGAITKALNKIKAAQTPPRFTQDYLGTTLDMPGGTAKPVIPFLKRTGFLGSDGTPTELYKRFRNPAQSGAAAAEALRTGYKPLYAINEYAHNAKDADLKGLIVQATGAEKDSKTVQATFGSFKALKSFADFSATLSDENATPDAPDGDGGDGGGAGGGDLLGGMNLGYTINLHLPATSDVAVFNAIFKSLREHILR
jgi:hypothetical protein